MGWIFTFIAIFGFILNTYYFFKALHNLTEKGNNHYAFVFFFFAYVPNDNFTVIGQNFRKLSFITSIITFVTLLWFASYL
jgi:hypothetical protein